jgi:hypothetical protein
MSEQDSPLGAAATTANTVARTANGEVMVYLKTDGLAIRSAVCAVTLMGIEYGTVAGMRCRYIEVMFTPLDAVADDYLAMRE